MEKIYIVIKTDLNTRRDKILKVFSSLSKAYDYIKELYNDKELENYEKLVDIDNENKEMSILILFIKETYEFINISIHKIN